MLTPNQRPDFPQLISSPGHSSTAHALGRGNVLGGAVLGVDSELHKDDAVLDDGAQRAEEPGEGGEEVLGLLGVGEEAEAVGHVAGEREEEEEQRET